MFIRTGGAGDDKRHSDGNSGIMNGAVALGVGQNPWRILFVAAMIAGSLLQANTAEQQ